MNQNKKTRLGALDVFIILAVIICAVCLTLRMMGGSEAVNTMEEKEAYTLVLSVKNIRETSVKYFDTGEKFYLEKEKARIPLGEVVSIQGNDAQTHYTDADGTTILVPNSAVTEQSKRKDVIVVLEIEGVRTADGSFLLDGSDYLAVNKKIKIASKYVEVTGNVLSIEAVKTAK